LRSRGYATAALGKWHLGYDLQFSPLERGFDEHWGFYEAFSLYAPTDDPDVVNTPIDDFSDRHMWSRGRDGASAIVHNDREVTEGEYLTSAIADRAAAYIDLNADTGQPFLLYVPFSAPHTPLQAPREEWDQLSHVSNPTHRTYYAMIAALDAAVGEILASLERNQIADHTLVIFASDNGGVTYLGVTDNGARAGGKFTTFQGGVAVPMMIRYPGQIPPGSVYRSPVSLLDLFATVEAATRRPGEPTPAEALARPYDGVDLVPYVTGRRDAPPHRTLFWRGDTVYAARSGPWKLLYDANRDLVRLFNLDEDPREQEDLAAARPDVVQDLRAQLAAWEEQLQPPAWPAVMDFFIDVWGERYWFPI